MSACRRLTSWRPILASHWTRGLAPKSLGVRTIPETVRAGIDEENCPLCACDDDAYLWTDEHWRLLPYRAVPRRGCVILEGRLQLDSFVDLPEDVAVSFGPVITRIERAVLSIGHRTRPRCPVGRGHRPLPFVGHASTLGVLEMRGPALMSWLEALTLLVERVAAEAHATIAQAVHG